jgi:hypothetical protein
MAKLYIQAILLGLIIIIGAQENDSNEIFYSSFESSQFLTLEDLNRGARSIKLVPNTDIDEWSQKGGKGIIQGFSMNMWDTFSYDSRKGHVLYGVKGIKKSHPRFSDVRFGTLEHWTERSPNIHVDKQGYFGLYAAELSAPQGTYNALTNYVSPQKDFWISFYVKLSKLYLDEISGERAEWFHELKDNEKYRGFVFGGVVNDSINKRICPALYLNFFGEGGDTIVAEDVNIEPDRYYGFEYHYGISERGVPFVKFFINDQKVGLKRAPENSSVNTLNRVRFFTRHRNVFWVDEVRLTADRFGFVPPQPLPPSIGWSEGPDPIYFEMEDTGEVEIKGMQWRISRSQSWDVEAWGSGLQKPAVRLAVPATIFQKTGEYYARSREIKSSDLYSNWMISWRFQEING